MRQREIVSEKQTAIALQSKVVDAGTFNQLLLVSHELLIIPTYFYSGHLLYLLT